MKSSFELINTINLPEYAIFFIENGNNETISANDEELISELLRYYEDNYENVIFEYGEESFFTHSPEFGPPCDCIETKVFGIKLNLTD